jgi:hypothetical protein
MGVHFRWKGSGDPQLNSRRGSFKLGGPGLSNMSYSNDAEPRATYTLIEREQTFIQIHRHPTRRTTTIFPLTGYSGGFPQEACHRGSLTDKRRTRTYNDSFRLGLGGGGPERASPPGCVLGQEVDAPCRILAAWQLRRGWQLSVLLPLGLRPFRYRPDLEKPEWLGI